MSVFNSQFILAEKVMPVMQSFEAGETQCFPFCELFIQTVSGE